MQLSSKAGYVLSIAIPLWLSLIAVGFYAILSHEFRHESTPTLAPKTQALGLDLSSNRPADGSRIVLGIHPQCPCTQSTLNSLARLLDAHPALRSEILVYRSKATQGLPSSTVDFAKTLPRTTLRDDADGFAARSLGISTSGTAVLFDGQSQIRFQGGLTIGRGCPVVGPGERAIAEFLHTNNSHLETAPTFGCLIQSGEPSLLPPL